MADTDGRGAEVNRLRDRVRIVVALAFVAGIAVDRVGPVISDDWQQYSDWSLGLMLAAVLVLLGTESIAVIFARFFGGR